MARREPSDKTMMTDNLEGHRSLGCTYLSTIYCRPDNIFYQFCKTKLSLRPAPDQPLRTAGERSPCWRVEGQISAENEELRGVVTGAGDSQTKDTNLLILILLSCLSFNTVATHDGNIKLMSRYLYLLLRNT